MGQNTRTGWNSKIACNNLVQLGAPQLSFRTSQQYWLNGATWICGVSLVGNESCSNDVLAGMLFRTSVYWDHSSSRSDLQED